MKKEVNKISRTMTSAVLAGAAIVPVLAGTAATIKAEDKVVVTATANIEGAGEITGAGSYDASENVVLTATPANGYIFEGWYEGDELKESSSTYSFEATASVTLTAKFSAVKTITVSVNDSTLGSVKATNADNNEITVDGDSYVEGSKIKLVATPSENATFVGWFNGDTNLSTDAEYTVTLNDNMSIVAKFEASENPPAETKNAVKLSVSNETAGTVTGAGEFTQGSTVTVTATPNTGYKFVKWTENGVSVSTDAKYTFELKKDIELVAVFEAENTTPTEVTITTAVNDTAMGSVTGSVKAKIDDKVTLTATPKDGYKFVKWIDEASNVISTDATITIVASKDATYVAIFEALPIKEYTVKGLVNNANYGSVTGAGVYKEGAVATLKAVPAMGYKFVNWTDSTGATVSTSDTITVNVSSDVTYTANFAASSSKTCKIKVRANDSSRGTVLGADTYAKGSSVTISAQAANGYVFDHWEDADGKNVSSDKDYTFTVKADNTYTAYFISADATEVTLSFVDKDDDGVEDVTITIYNSKNKKLGSYTTDEDGEITVKLEEGSYTYKITDYKDADKDLLYPTATYSFKVKSNGKVTGTDELTLKPASFEVTRKDGVTGNPISGATLTFYNNSNAKVASVTTDTKGIATIKGLQPGTYTYSETTPGRGYSTDANIYKVVIGEDGTITGDLTSSTSSFKVTLSAKDKNTDKGLSNVTIYIYSGNNLAGIYQTGLNGTVEVAGIPAGSYTITQGTLPSGYKAVDEKATFSIDAKGAITGTTVLYSTDSKSTTNGNDAPTNNTNNSANNTNNDAPNNTSKPSVDDKNNGSTDAPVNNTSKPSVDTSKSDSSTNTPTVDNSNSSNTTKTEIITTGVETKKKSNAGAIVSIVVGSVAAIGAGAVALIKKFKKQ